MGFSAHPPSSSVVKEEYCSTVTPLLVIHGLLRVNFIFVNLLANRDLWIIQLQFLQYQDVTLYL
jgi:hypothetical protein